MVRPQIECGLRCPESLAMMFPDLGRCLHLERTSVLDNEEGFFQEFLLKNYLLPANCLGFD